MEGSVKLREKRNEKRKGREGKENVTIESEIENVTIERENKFLDFPRPLSFSSFSVTGSQFHHFSFAFSYSPLSLCTFFLIPSLSHSPFLTFFTSPGH